MSGWQRSSDDSYTGPLPCFYLQYKEVIIGVVALTFLLSPAAMVLGCLSRTYASALSEKAAGNEQPQGSA